MKKKSDVKVVSKNHKAYFRYSILEKYEAGVSLFGHEVKSLRSGKASIEEGLVRLDGDELYLFNVHIPPYSHLSHVDYEPTRTRKLLMHRKEIVKISDQVKLKGLTLIPLEIYFKRGYAKISVGLGKGKKAHDRRDEMKKKDALRDIRDHY